MPRWFPHIVYCLAGPDHKAYKRMVAHRKSALKPPIGDDLTRPKLESSPWVIYCDPWKRKVSWFRYTRLIGNIFLNTSLVWYSYLITVWSKTWKSSSFYGLFVRVLINSVSPPHPPPSPHETGVGLAIFVNEFGIKHKVMDFYQFVECANVSYGVGIA